MPASIQNGHFKPPQPHRRLHGRLNSPDTCSYLKSTVPIARCRQHRALHAHEYTPCEYANNESTNAHQRRLSNNLKALRGEAKLVRPFAIKRTAFPTWHTEPEATSLPTGKRQHRRKAQQRGHHCQKTPRWGPTAEKSCRIVRKRCKGASFSVPHDEQSRAATAKPQVTNIPNAEFPHSARATCPQ